MGTKMELPGRKNIRQCPQMSLLTARAAYNRAVNVPVNVVIVAREANEYSDKKIVGVKPEADASTKYVADITLRLVREGAKRFAVVQKNRYEPALAALGQSLPGRFELTRDKPLIAWLEPVMALSEQGELVDRGDEEIAIKTASSRMLEEASPKQKPAVSTDKSKELVDLITAYGLDVDQTRAACLDEFETYRPHQHDGWLTFIRQYAIDTHLRSIFGDVSGDELEDILNTAEEEVGVPYSSDSKSDYDLVFRAMKQDMPA